MNLFYFLDISPTLQGKITGIFTETINLYLYKQMIRQASPILSIELDLCIKLHS